MFGTLMCLPVGKKKQVNKKKTIVYALKEKLTKHSYAKDTAHLKVHCIGFGGSVSRN